MSALITDVLEGTISPGICNAVANTSGKMLKAAEMQMKYGTSQANRVLTLTGQVRELKPVEVVETAQLTTGRKKAA